MTYSGNLIRKSPLAATQDSASGIWTLDQAQAAVRANTWPVANGVSRSLRFNSADSAFLTRTPASASNRRIWTWSGWVKRASFTEQFLFGVANAGNDADYTNLQFFDGRINFSNWTGGINVYPLAQLRDPSAWYHVVLKVNTTQATASDRVSIYLNGIQLTDLGNANYPSQNSDLPINAAKLHHIGARLTSGVISPFDGYLTDINFVDGLALTPSDFALTDPDSNQWRPKRYSGSHGVNGFYLDFSDNTSTTNLGLDRSGYTNDWTASGFTVTGDSDSVVDTPTNYNFDFGAGGEVRGNYCTVNPLAGSAAGGSLPAPFDGNLNINYTAVGQWQRHVASMAVPNTGKWYWEITIPQVVSGGGQSANYLFGIADSNNLSLYPTNDGGNSGYLSFWIDAGVARTAIGARQVVTAYGSVPTNNSLLMVAVDSDSNKIWWGLNGTWFNSADQAAGMNAGLSLSSSINYIPVISAYGYSGQTPLHVRCNFGQQPFAYTAPEGFKALVTTNLPEPTIGTGPTTQSNNYFDVVTYSGTGTTQTVTGLGFQPDLIWVKNRSNNYHHGLFDSVRGANKVLVSSNSAAEVTYTQQLTSFNSNGFTLGTNSDSGNYVNLSNNSYVAWCWRAGGAAVANTQGTITSQVSANTDAGFSVVTYTGNNTVAQSVGHGLGAAPAMIIVKSRSNVTNWLVWHKDYSVNSLLLLNDTSGVITPGTGLWGSATPTSTTFGLNRADSDNNRSGESHVAYCWAEVAGFSKFGSYTANGSVDGPFIYCGFKPRFIMIKATSATSQWVMIDTARDTFNSTASRSIFANSSSAEETGNTAEAFDIVSNGFKLRSNGRVNVNTVTHIFMAFAEAPFGNVNGTAR